MSFKKLRVYSNAATIQRSRKGHEWHMMGHGPVLQCSEKNRTMFMTPTRDARDMTVRFVADAVRNYKQR